MWPKSVDDYIKTKNYWLIQRFYNRRARFWHILLKGRRESSISQVTKDNCSVLLYLCLEKREGLFPDRERESDLFNLRVKGHPNKLESYTLCMGFRRFSKPHNSYTKVNTRSDYSQWMHRDLTPGILIKDYMLMIPWDPVHNYHFWMKESSVFCTQTQQNPEQFL